MRGNLAIVPLEGAGLGPAGLGPLSLLGLACLRSPSLPFLLPLGLFPGPFVVAIVGWGLTPPTGWLFPRLSRFFLSSAESLFWWVVLCLAAGPWSFVV